MGKVYVIANRKGGCAKTTTTGALASGLTRCGYKVLVVDTDPQGNISDWAGIKTDGLDTIYEVLIGECDTKEAICHAANYDIIPADESLSVIEAALAGKPAKETILKKKLQKVKDDYDFVIIDTPPSLGLLTLSAFTAADGGVVITSDASSFATKGMAKLAETLDSIEETTNPDVRVAGILIARVNPQTVQFKVVKEATRAFGEYFDAELYQTPIRQTTVVMNSQLRAMDLFDNPRVNPAVQDYKEFISEFLEREGYPRPELSSFDRKAK